jgi:hypothetical protein
MQITFKNQEISKETKVIPNITIQQDKDLLP